MIQVTRDTERAVPKGGVACPFPWRVHEMLHAAELEGFEDIVAWRPHGRAFTVFKPKDFAEKVLTRFFDQTKYPSFQRQLNIYGFSRFSKGPDKGAYYHMCFVRYERSLVQGMVRRKIKGTKVRRRPVYEPDFYAPEWSHSNTDEASGAPDKVRSLDTDSVVSRESSSENDDTSIDLTAAALDLVLTDEAFNLEKDAIDLADFFESPNPFDLSPEDEQALTAFL